MISSFLPALRESGAPNYLSFDAYDRSDGSKYVLIIVKPDGKTPHELRQEAEAEVSRLREQVLTLSSAGGAS